MSYYYLADPVLERRAWFMARLPAGHNLSAERNWLWCGDRAILWSREAISASGLILVSTAADEIAGAVAKAAVEALAKDREFSDGLRFNDMIAKLFMEPGEARKGLPFRSNKLTQEFELYLGPLGQKFWSAPDPVKRLATVTYTDDFSGDGDLNGRTFSGGGSTWTEVAGTRWVTSGGEAQCLSMGSDEFDQGVSSASTDTDDQYVDANMTQLVYGTGTGVFIGVTGRCSSDGATGVLFQLAKVGAASGGAGVYDVPAFTALYEDSTYRASGRIRITCNGGNAVASVDGADIMSPAATGVSGSSQRRGAMNAYADPGTTGCGGAYGDFTLSDIGGNAWVPQGWDNLVPKQRPVGHVGY